MLTDDPPSYARPLAGKASALHVMGTAEPEEHPTKGGSTGYLYRGRDAGGREIEVIAVDVTEDG